VELREQELRVSNNVPPQKILCCYMDIPTRKKKYEAIIDSKNSWRVHDVSSVEKKCAIERNSNVKVNMCYNVTHL